MNEGEKLRLEIRKSRLTGDAILQKMGKAISRPTLYDLFKRKTIGEPYRALFKGIGIDIWSESQAPYIATPIKADGTKNLIPLYNAKAMAGLQTIKSNEAEYVEGYYSVPVPKATHLMRIAGNSMYPKYCNGDMVAVQLLTNHNYIHLGSAHIIVLNEQIFIKFIRKGKSEDEWILEPVNTDNFDSFPVKKTDVLRLYVVRGTVRLDEL